MRMSTSEKDKKQHRIFITTDSLPGKDVVEFFNISNYLSKGLFLFILASFCFFFQACFSTAMITSIANIALLQTFELVSLF